MNAQSKIEAAEAEKPTGLALLREPFPDNLISKLPKPTKAQNDAVKSNFKAGARCKLCGAWHHPDVVHLDYVGHAALTHRLLDADPAWNWEPLAFTPEGLPSFDKSGGLWIKLTVCGQTRLGYGHAAGKPNQDPGAREKEVIGDALRNAAMRFGAALDLWHKGDLRADDPDDGEGQKPAERDAGRGSRDPEPISQTQWSSIISLLEATNATIWPILKHFGVDDLKQLTCNQAIKTINQLEDKLAAMAREKSNRASQGNGGFADIDASDIPF